MLYFQLEAPHLATNQGPPELQPSILVELHPATPGGGDYNRGAQSCIQRQGGLQSAAPLDSRVAIVHVGVATGVWGSYKVVQADDNDEPEMATPCYDGMRDLMDRLLFRTASGKTWC
ncbi:uncharacterized protein LOC119270361 [Triticum dicoccoides]|uniref:uncharacterized protein LOC119270361 n=1 Tax=Triticum dicoccoides TaxID=85692 RepID=UPI00189040B0|nr:uncharacterized protein LOC119270361 [Triticum dicoccoides]